MIDGGYLFLGLIIIILVVVALGNSGRPAPAEKREKPKRKRKRIEINGIEYEEVDKNQPGELIILEGMRDDDGRNCYSICSWKTCG